MSYLSCLLKTSAISLLISKHPSAGHTRVVTRLPILCVHYIFTYQSQMTSDTANLLVEWVFCVIYPWKFGGRF